MNSYSLTTDEQVEQLLESTFPTIELLFFPNQENPYHLNFFNQHTFQYNKERFLAIINQFIQFYEKNTRQPFEYDSSPNYEHRD